SGIEVVLEKIEGCKSKSKWCSFRPGHSYTTEFFILADPGVTLKFQQFTFKDSETGLMKISRHYFCGIDGLPNCEYISEFGIFINGKLNLDS
ncbi:hypothetical protein MXB_758, partial [Myxobolus squamalis]